MRLEKIKLAGFKSFVDPTVIPITSNLTGIVGPNGCGKSNIIDAVRWVMGESSAKHLRGQQMADVIFNGSATRKPVHTASVELIFDNAAGKTGGEYARYAQISIKRQVSRDGQSDYFLNGARCRRKDITDLFLGTGLGSRSYAIIEQGTISRMVEAKPEELREHIEEAAGISKYKERRHETETRIRNTRENLARLSDVRDEVDKQLKSLAKQAQKAERYTALKQQEHRCQTELLAMRWQTQHRAYQDAARQLQDAATLHNALFAEAHELAQRLTQQRDEQKHAQDELNRVQAHYYRLTADIGRLQQTIEHQRRNQAEARDELERLQQQQRELTAEMALDHEELETVRAECRDAEAAWRIAQDEEVHAKHAQQTQQAARASWQQKWEQHLASAAAAREQHEIQRAKLAQLTNQAQQLRQRAQRLQNEHDELSNTDDASEIESLREKIAALTEEREHAQAALAAAQQNHQQAQQRARQLRDTLDAVRAESHSLQGQISSLTVLQQHAMGKDNAALNDWLAPFAWAQSARLAELIDVEPGWENAVECVLAPFLDALCSDDADAVRAAWPSPPPAAIAVLAPHRLSQAGATETTTDVIPTATLAQKLHAPWPLQALLGEVYAVENVDAAHALLPQLHTRQSLITRDGVWLGSGWLRYVQTPDGKAGVIKREHDLRQLKIEQATLQTRAEEQRAAIAAAETDAKQAEQAAGAHQARLQTLASDITAHSAALSALRARWEQQQRRLIQIEQELAELDNDLQDITEASALARELAEQAQQRLQALAVEREALQKQQSDWQTASTDCDAALDQASRRVREEETRVNGLRAREQALLKQLQRLTQQSEQHRVRLLQWQQRLTTGDQPLDDELAQLENLNTEKINVEAALKQAKQRLEQTERVVQELDEHHRLTQRKVEQQRAALDKIRLDQQQSLVRQQTLEEQLQERDAQIEAVLQKLPADADEETWKNRLRDLTAEIGKLGTINLAAIEEYQAQAQRKAFLDEQHQDLATSLATLEQAMAKIDRETRQRFKETFDKINQGLQQNFPKLFGGGQAYLELTDQDLLECGVHIIARPPGKRNSSIHLLSGGEKALTAVALVFAIFELNPAPFCLLDEVDAPLDDANVGRFSKMVEEMSQAVQFLFISHNKVTMEIAKQLAGVTMKEPGVSRMVAVDIEEAINLAES